MCLQGLLHQWVEFVAVDDHTALVSIILDLAGHQSRTQYSDSIKLGYIHNGIAARYAIKDIFLGLHAC